MPGTLNISNSTQVITFPSIGTKVYGTPVTLNATASSGLPVTYSVLSGSAIIKDNILTITGSGEITVAANQAGDDTYTPASQVTRTFICLPETPALHGIVTQEEYLFRSIRSCSVSWLLSSDKNLDFYELYRDEVWLQTYRPWEALIYNDYNKPISSNHTYSLKAVNKEGHESSVSTRSLP